MAKACKVASQVESHPKAKAKGRVKRVAKQGSSNLVVARFIERDYA